MNKSLDPDVVIKKLRSDIANVADRERINLLLQLAEALQQQGEHKQFLDAVIEAYTLAEMLGDTNGQAEALRWQGVMELYHANYVAALELFRRAQVLFEAINNYSGGARATSNIGLAHWNLTNYTQALEYYADALSVYENLQDQIGIARVVGNIGMVYWSLLDFPQALEYYSQSLELYMTFNHHQNVAAMLGNIGSVYYTLGDYNKALEHHQRALLLYEEIGNQGGIAWAIGNIGTTYLSLSEYPQALESCTQALHFYELIGDRASAARAIANIGILYSNKAFAAYNPDSSEEFLLKAVALNQELGTKQQLYTAYECLANLYEQTGRWQEALQEFKKYHATYQEVQSEEAHKKAIQVEQQRQIAELEKRTAAERARAKATEELLHKTLPPSIADRMISGEQKIADRFDSVSVLFADVVGFTPMTASMPASAVLEFMNFVFAHFDSIASKHGCERIKTIGDGYMAVCGAPIECEDHAERIARMAMEMLEDITLPESITEHLPSGAEFEIRIGLHCGSITAGVIGTGKLAYDIYGDAVNTASRMESHGEAGKIHVSEEFAEELRRSGGGESSMILTERGIIELKGKGERLTYFLSQAVK